MYQDKPEWIAHQRQRWLRPDAERWLRPDAHRWMTPEAQRWLPPECKQAAARPEPVDLAALEAARERLLLLRDDVSSFRADLQFRQFFRSLKAGFRYNQPRWPRGTGRIGGRWSRGAGTGPGAETNTGPKRGGHHFVPREIFDDPALRLHPETRRVFEQGRTGPLNAGPHGWSKEHKPYNDAVKEAFERFLNANDISSDMMTPDQARQFLDEVKRSTDPRIRGLNMRIYIREIMFWFRRFPRGSD